MSRRWLVERARDVFEDVGAEFVTVQDGCLVFSDSVAAGPTSILAAGQWITCCPDEAGRPYICRHGKYATEHSCDDHADHADHADRPEAKSSSRLKAGQGRGGHQQEGYDMPEIHDLLARDALGEAEKITGRSYKDDAETMSLGFGLHMLFNAEKKAALEAANDSHFSMELAETLALYADMGFVEVLCDEFTGSSWDGEPAQTETYRILWHADGLLATVESYNTTGRNSTRVYYNVAITDRSDFWSRISSGSWADGEVWVGDHDAREGIRTNLSRLAEAGKFLPVWVQAPFLWFVTYGEMNADGYDYAAINAERTSRLPEHVQAAIAGGAA